MHLVIENVYTSPNGDVTRFEMGLCKTICIMLSLYPATREQTIVLYGSETRHLSKMHVTRIRVNTDEV